jgi:peptide/nickel transport system permease protein
MPDLAADTAWRRAARVLLRNRPALASAVVLAALYVLAAFAGFVGPYDPERTDSTRFFQPPQRIHLFDDAGRFRGLHVCPMRPLGSGQR